jgi:predicted Zn-dependent protease
MPRMILAAVALALMLSAPAWLGGCAANPVTGSQELSFVSESQELAIGRKNYGPYRQAQGGDYVVEPELTRYVRGVGDRLARVSDRKLPYEFSIINDSTPNAWALPGGKIAINRGLLVELDNEAELAAVLGHEIVHAAARHSAQSIERGTLLQGALLAAGVALAGTDYREVGMMGAGVGATLVNQKYGRDDETEADRYGMQYMVRAGYDPAAAVRLQETFVRLAEGRRQNWLEGLFASHPPSRERVAANRRMVAELGNPGGELGRDRYQRATARLQRNKPAYEAYAEAQEALGDGDLRTALRKVERAIAIEPDEAQFYALRGEIHSARSNDAAARRDLDKAVALNPDYYRPVLVRGLARGRGGDLAAAERDLQRSLALLPTAEAYYGLGEVAQRRNRRDEAVAWYRKAAGSRSSVGSRARDRLANLDLQDNPARYLDARLGLAADGYLVVQVRNTTTVTVRDVRVAVGQRYGDRIQTRESLRLSGSLGPGAATRLRTRLGPMGAEQARRYAAIVTDARPAGSAR